MSGNQSDDVEDDREEEEEEEEEVVLNSIDLETLSRLPMQLMLLSSLRPTQAYVGMHAVREKAAKIRATKEGKLLTKHKKLTKWLSKDKRKIPCVMGPTSDSPSYWLVDHHHLSYALMLAGVKEAYVVVIEDLSGLTMDHFWHVMAERKRIWTHDSNGGDLSLSEAVEKLPQSISELRDDPHRSLSGLLRRAGGYAKSRVPFSEFM